LERRSGDFESRLGPSRLRVASSDQPDGF
jgi:hypothetical protein